MSDRRSLETLREWAGDWARIERDLDKRIERYEDLSDQAKDDVDAECDYNEQLKARIKEEWQKWCRFFNHITLEERHELHLIKNQLDDHTRELM